MSERILVVSPAWVGDMIMAQTLYKLLKAKHADTEIDVLAPPTTLSLVSRMPEVSRGIRFDLDHGELNFAKRRMIAASLREATYKQAIILPNSLKSALVPFFADIPRRTGFRGEFRYVLLNDIRLLNKRKLPRMIDRFAYLASEQDAFESIEANLEFPALMVNEHNLEKLKIKFELDSSRKIMTICPGAEFGEAKKWPEQHYAKAADQAIERGMQVWIFGGPKDKESASSIKALMSLTNLSHCVDFTGQTSLLDVIDLLSLSALVVSNDSGLMHIAAAVGCQTAVIYGSTSPVFTPPLTEKLDILSLNLDCSPCFKRTCPLQHKSCLVDLKPDVLIPIIEASCE